MSRMFSLAKAMPPDQFHLLTTGHVMASERLENGWPTVSCADCGEPVDMIWRHDPITEDFLKTRRTIPGSVWGKDVIVICAHCSFAKGGE